MFGGCSGLLLNNMLCERKCVLFFGFKILDLELINEHVGNERLLNIFITAVIILVLYYLKPFIFKDIKNYE